MASGSNSGDCQTSARRSERRKAIPNAMRTPQPVRSDAADLTSAISAYRMRYILDRVAISVVDMVDMGQSPGKRLATGCPALVG